jgi:methyl-accepting chemotaxis protein
MRGISDSSRRIGDIVGVIDGIAFQTNILALNAAVEAARAGEQGRGFAVVASEVRTLAQRSAQAAKEITGLITASVSQVDQGVTLVDEAGQAMSGLVGSIQQVSRMIEEISAASDGQSTSVRQVVEAVSQMDMVTQQNAALVEQSAAAAEGLKHQATRLVDAVSVFRTA